MNVSVTRKTTIVIGDQAVELTDEQVEELRAKLGIQPPAVVYVPAPYPVYPAIQPAIVPINPLPWTPYYGPTCSPNYCGDPPWSCSSIGQSEYNQPALSCGNFMAARDFGVMAQ